MALNQALRRVWILPRTVFSFATTFRGDSVSLKLSLLCSVSSWGHFLHRPVTGCKLHAQGHAGTSILYRKVIFAGSVSESVVVAQCWSSKITSAVDDTCSGRVR